MVVPLEDQLATLEKAKKGITQHDRMLETLIVVVSQQSIAAAEELLSTIQVSIKPFRIGSKFSKLSFLDFRTAKTAN
jgi:hypothetical protein